MYRFYLAAVDLLPAMLLLIPTYWILNRAYFHDIRKSFFYFIFSCYLAAVYTLVGLPNVTYIRPEVNLNLIPVYDMIGDKLPILFHMGDHRYDYSTPQDCAAFWICFPGCR